MTRGMWSVEQGVKIIRYVAQVIAQVTLKEELSNEQCGIKRSPKRIRMLGGTTA